MRVNPSAQDRMGWGGVGLGIGVGVRERGIGRYLVPFLDFLNYVLLGKVDHTGSTQDERAVKNKVRLQESCHV